MDFLNTLSTMEAESLFAWLTVMTFILFGVVGMSRLIEYACDLWGRLATMRDHNLTKPQPIIKVGDQAEPFLKAVKEQDNG